MSRPCRLVWVVAKGVYSSLSCGGFVFALELLAPHTPQAQEDVMCTAEGP